MADYLDRLAARAIGGGSGVVPRLRGRFEPEAHALSDVDSIDWEAPAARSVGAAPLDPPPIGSAPAGSGSPGPQSGDAVAAGVVPVDAAPSGAGSPGRGPASVALSSPGPGSPLPSGSAPASGAPLSVDQPATHWFDTDASGGDGPGGDRSHPARPTAQSSPGPAVRPLATLAPRWSPSGPALRPVPPAVSDPAPSTVVRISIGRIEVRAAVAPPPPPPPRPARPAPPARSLADYVNGDDGRPR